ncbi:MAG: hypothetical protein QOI10_4589 [Solirubrobacterales bacterium]|nr:hypothetical protein [Solirubrobacterales bacterium]
MARRRIALLAAALALTAAPSALADGDPASDVLPSQDAFFPYTPPVSKPLVTALDKLLKQIRAAGYPMKVALIASAGDLGSYPQLFNSPQRYTDLLASELPANPHGSVKEKLHLLVLMPGGIGGQNLGDNVDSALAPVKIDPAAQSDGLARAALTAVARIATANGHKTAVPAEASPSAGKSDKGGGTSPVLFIVLGLVIAGLLAAMLVIRRRAASEMRPDEAPEVQDDAADTRST